MSKYVSSVVVTLAAIAVLITSHARAAPGPPGALDSSWATSSTLGAGKVITPIGSGDDIAYALALQADGKLVLAGVCYGEVNEDFCAVRYDSNGALDASFGAGGKVVTPVGSNIDIARAVTLQPDGKLVLAGWCYGAAGYNFCALRYQANGTLDTSFGTNGKVITPVGSRDDRARALALQPDGKLILSGDCFNGLDNDFCALRYNANGTLDTSFGSNASGTVITPVGSGYDFANALALQVDGKVVLAGYCAGTTRSNFCAVRYKANGTLDSDFGVGGKVITSIGSSTNEAHALAVQPDGKLVLAGHCSSGGNPSFCALRYQVDGALDTSFGPNGNGTVVTSLGSREAVAYALVLQPDGKLVMAGQCFDSISYDFCILRYQPNGALDTSFGSNENGTAITPVGSTGDVATALALRPDGKLVLAGYCTNASATNSDFCAAQLEGGPFGYKSCVMDIDGDGRVLATTDALILTRIALGITDNAVIGGITFAPHSTRNTWPLIRDYLVSQCGMSLVQ